MAGLAELAELAIPIAANIDRSYEKRFFHPIVCHVCKWLNNGNTIPCECGMLSYCSGEHLEIDRGRVLGSFGHGEICVVITSLIAMKEIRNYSLENNRWRQELRREGRPRRNKPWYKHHMTYLKVVQKNLSRNLEWHEKQMLLFARSCCICHEETDLSPCTTCFCVDFCAAHRNSKFPHDCEKQQEWLYTEMRSINVNPIPIYRPLHHFPDKQVDDIESFYERYMLPAKGVQWNVPDLVYSDYVSGPLTVYYGMRLANLFEDEPSAGDSYVIHIIEATEVDIDNVQSWEIFLHFFNKKTKLLIIMVGSEIEEELVKNLSGQLMTCVARCQTLDLTLNVEYHNMEEFFRVAKEIGLSASSDGPIESQRKTVHKENTKGPA
ncbi:uncharacterized protein LOC116842746 [Odontomachus brunneus]|uniref:uncharacterized protein LOC116842746 n=1 Tax=Odontomachus brunneus TaxID=486640 RepID=UPI0013F2A8C8|nr:uncharacterized protein LOC116842746 [Odontomachus brunneus]